MPLSWNEIRANAIAFSREWKDASSEDAEAQTFWNEFFKIFGITRRRIATFETPVKKSAGKGGFIDLLWKGVLLVEHKSRGLDLDRAFLQAKDYFHGLKERDLPRYVLVSDFARFRLYDLEEDTSQEFELSALPKHISLFGFIAGYQTRVFPQQDPVNIKAAEKLGRLHDLLLEAGYDGHALEIFLVRILFCLFAEDNAIFERQQFREWVEFRGKEDSSSVGPALGHLFQVLNTSPERRIKSLDEALAAFRYVNGKLFEEVIPIASFDRAMCEVLLDCTTLDWGRISPAIFGALFQSIMDKKARRNLGAHYTSETNILKALQPLFLDALLAEFERIRHDTNRLKAFHDKLSKIRILDPACGCGNFLVIAYRELRLIELDVLRELFKAAKGGHLDVSSIVFVDVDQFYGIEIEEFPAQIAQVALWMTDHQMNQLVSAEFGQYYVRLPLVKAPSIVHDNAIPLDWKIVVTPERLTYIVGNPPFVGHHLQTARQKAEMLTTYKAFDKAAGVMDYVTAWYNKAAEYIQQTDIRVAFVSTNSITQGEQVGILWRSLMRHNPIYIHFAHRTFKWTSEARGKAAVYCVIIGFGAQDMQAKMLFEYEHVNSKPQPVLVNQINAYLVNAPWIIFANRSRNIFNAPEMMYGSKPTDGGHFLFTDEEKVAFLKSEAGAKKYMKPFIGAHEYLHGEKRWVLWLDGIAPSDLNNLLSVRDRVKAVDQFRKASKAATTRAYPHATLFRQITQPKSQYVLVPGHTSETRAFIPFGFFNQNTIVGNSCFSIPGATLYHFGVLQSTAHMAWVRSTCGRLKSDYRYSKDIVYNNFPWPEPTDKQRATIETAAQAVLDERLRHPDSTLADLYDPLTMPPGLVKAHQTLDRAVDAAYGRTSFKTEAERVAFLFTLYEKLTSLFPTERRKPARKRKTATA